jgi:2-phosphoglycerate kinase
LADAFKVALIGGTSHVGKSTTALALAPQLGWEALSTDKLARHPGRPWPTPTWTPPDHVAVHYSTLTQDELIASVMAHYRNMWPMVRELVERRASDPAAMPLVLEGSALWPEPVAALDVPGVRAVWLTGDDTLTDARILLESRFDEADAAGRQLIEAFAARTRLFNASMMEAVRRLRLPFVEVPAAMSREEVAEAALRALRA